MTDLAPFATVSELEDTLQRPLPRDTAVSAVRRASGAIRGHCHWAISQEVVTNRVVNMRRLTGNLWLHTLWLQSVDKVVESGVTLPGTYYAWDESGRVVRGAGYWTPNLGELLIDYTHGYPEGDERLETVHDVCLAAATRIAGNPMRRSSESTGNESWQTGVGSVGSTLTDGEQEQLAHLVIEDP